MSTAYLLQKLTRALVTIWIIVTFVFVILRMSGDYLINPDVTVSMTQYRSFFLNGEVSRPGGYPYQPGLTLEKALALAGGLSPRAARHNLLVKSAREL